MLPSVLLEINPTHPEPRKIARAVAALSAGEIIAYPTDTVYGLGCDLTSKAAVERLYQWKRMPKTQAIAAAVGRPLISTTAAEHGSEPLQWAEQIAEAVPQVALILDGGPGGVEPTTVLDLTVQPPLVVREGAGPVDFLLDE